MKKFYIMNKALYLRIISYILIWQVYVLFMSFYAPLGIEWLPWHNQRLFNFSEYLSINGYFSSYGFSVWSSCSDCSLKAESNQIYITLNIFSNLFYVLFNDFFGSENFKLYAHYIDKIIIFLTGVIFSEIFIKLTRNINSDIYLTAKSILCFVFFTISPWTYKMLIASWIHIYFPLFFLVGILMFLNKKQNLGLFFLVVAGLFDYQSAAGITFFYFLIILIFLIKKEDSLFTEYFPVSINKRTQVYKIIFSLLLPVMLFFLLRLIATNQFELTQGSSLLTRIGISGDDTHNGGILGAIQFLAGNRITQCLVNFDFNSELMDFSKSIYVYNCILSLTSMFLISLISLFGLFILFRNNIVFFNYIILPFIFLLLAFTFILQQSSSAHLMGYSYLFSLLFSAGIVNIIFNILNKYNFSVVSLILAVPSVLGIVLLCIRVSMLTGING